MLSNLLRPLLLMAICIGLLPWPTINADPVEDLLPGQNAAEVKEALAAKTISVQDDGITDAAIKARLQNIYQNLDELRGISIDVNSGVVTLSGELLTLSAEGEALKLAAQVEGVVGIENKLIRIKNIKVRLRHTLESLKERGYELISYAPLLVVALLIVFVFWLLSKWVLLWDGLFRRFSDNAFIIDLLKQITRAALIMTGLLIALEILDATAILGSLLGAAGLLGLAIGFAIRDSVENYLASILLSIRQPFAPNDHILLDSYEGKVIRLTSRATILMTFEGNHVRIPNALVYKGVITNFTRNPERRFDFQVGVDSEVELTEARALAIKTLLETEGVLESPAPSCQIGELGDSNVVLKLYGWTDQSRFDFGKVRSAAIQNLKAAFDAAGFEMPEPIYRLRFQNAAEAEPAPESAQSDAVVSTHKLSSEHLSLALGVNRDTTLDSKILREAATEDDLLSDEVAKE